MAGSLRPNPPSLELNGRWNVRTLGKKVPKKIIFSLMARSYSPLLMARPSKEELFSSRTKCFFSGRTTKVRVPSPLKLSGS